jgi:hypothetical protein
LRRDRYHVYGFRRRFRPGPKDFIPAQPRIGFSTLHGASDVVKISAIGVGMRSHAGVAALAFKALAEKASILERLRPPK